jgi:hypothetical protein
MRASVLGPGILVATAVIPGARKMKDAIRLPERKDVDQDQFPCRSCGEKFNTLAEAEQHEKDCGNRKTSGAGPR